MKRLFPEVWTGERVVGTTGTAVGNGPRLNGKAESALHGGHGDPRQAGAGLPMGDTGSAEPQQVENAQPLSAHPRIYHQCCPLVMPNRMPASLGAEPAQKRGEGIPGCVASGEPPE